VAAPAGARVLTGKDLNRALLARQLLADRARLPITGVLERMGGLQAQYAPSMYIGLWTRMHGFARDELTRALEARTVVQGTLLRSTIHLVSAGDYWPFALAVRSGRRKWATSAAGRPGAAEVEAAATRLRERLRDGPAHRREVEEIVGRALVNGVGLWVDLVRVPPSGTWERRRADVYAAAEEWLGPPPPGLTADDALDHIVARYLAGFGPSSAAEVASWAGLAVSDVAPALRRVATARFAAENGDVLFDADGGVLPDRDSAVPVRLLPVWDATLLVHARRTGILPEEYRPLVFNTKTPHSVQTFLVDGAVAGTWNVDGSGVSLEPYRPLPAAVRRALLDEGERVAALYTR
jgi:hypothetical protein